MIAAVLTLLGKELKEIVRDPRTLFASLSFALAGPFVLVAVVYGIAASSRPARACKDEHGDSAHSQRRNRRGAVVARGAGRTVNERPDARGLADDARIIRRQVTAGWIMLAAAAAFLGAVGALSIHDSTSLANPVRLSVLLLAAVFLGGGSVWQWQFARRRADELRVLLRFHDELRA